MDGVLTAKDRNDGKQLWSPELRSESVEMMAAQGSLLIANLDKFTVFEGATGKQLWQFTTNYDAKLPEIEGDIAYTQLDAKDEYHPGIGITRGRDHF